MSGINLNTRPLNLKLKHPFGLSRGITHIAKNVLVTLAFEDYMAYGEAAPSAYYGEDQKSVMEFINAFAKNRSLDPYLTNINMLKEDMNAFNLSMNRTVNSNLFSYSARLALEIAFWDLIGKINNKPTFECLFNTNPFLEKKNNGGLPSTSYTIAIDEIPIMEAKTKEALKKGFNVLKIKLGLGFDKDMEILNTVSEAAKDQNYILRVDANGGWDLETTKKFVDILPEYNVDLIEQPLRKGASHELAGVVQHSTIPIIVDEDCMNISDIESLAGNVHGVNIKLMKTGSVIDAIAND